MVQYGYKIQRCVNGTLPVISLKRESDVARAGYKWLNNIWLGKGAVIGCNAMLLPFSLPVIVWLVISQCYSSLLVRTGGAVGGSVILTFLGLLPCALILAVGLSGALYCNKCTLVDGEMDIRHRFAVGIKKNAPKYMLFTFIMWLSTALAVITPTLYSYMGVSILYGVGTAIAIIQLLLVAPTMCIAMAQCVYYDDKLRYVFPNAFKLYFMRPIRMTGVAIVSALPFVFCMLFPFGWQVAFWVIYVVVGVSVGMIFYLWYAKRYFDAVVGNFEDDVVALSKEDTVADEQQVDGAQVQQPASDNLGN